MYSYEHVPYEWFTSGRQLRQSCYPPPMSRPVTKNFNRISDFIFPDTVHVRYPPSVHYQKQKQQFNNQRYQRIDNYSLPVLNHRDLIIVERLPVDEFDDLDFVYREQYPISNRQIQRRYSSVGYGHQVSCDERIPPSLKNRSVAYRDKLRDRRKRHTTDNTHHSILKTIVEKDHQQNRSNGNSNYILSYRTTLDPITDSDSMTSIKQENHQRRQNNDTSNYRVSINEPKPIINEHVRSRQFSSTISTRDSSSDTEITERHPKTMNCIRYQQDSSYVISSDIPTNDWEHLSSNDVHLQSQPDRFTPITSSMVDANNYEVVSDSNNLITSSVYNSVINEQINNRKSSQDSTHHVSLCVNDLHTTLFIDQDALNSTKKIFNNDNTNGNNDKKVIKTFIDRIIKRLQHFKSSLDNGLTHIRKRNTLVNGPIISADYCSHKEMRKRKTNMKLTTDVENEKKFARPYFLIKPQSILVLPNETAKFKCCFTGDAHTTLVWSHNELQIPQMKAMNAVGSSRYKTYKLHDIHYLDIASISLSDQGQIKCTIINKFGREEVTAQLLVAPSPADATPYIAQPLNDVCVIEGQPLEISCVINGLQVTVNWFHNGKSISSTTQSKSDYNNESSIFSLSRCLKNDAGKIECLIKNRFGEARTSCRIEVVNRLEFGNR